jgi:MFS transporter, ACS family, tartrate transporter
MEEVAIPSVLLGIVTWFYLADRPEKADWLTKEQKAWLSAKLQAEIATKQAAKHLTLGEALSSPKVIMLSLIYFGFVGALHGMQFWLPQIVKAFGLTNAQTGFVTAIPYLFGTIAMILWARHSDATRERVAHVGGPLLLTALALGVSSYITDPAITMAVLTVAAIGIFCTFAVFWTLPTAWLSGTAAAGGIALINSIGNLAGFGGPYRIGWVKEATGNTSTGLLVLSLLPLAAGLRVFLGGHQTKTEFADAKWPAARMEPTGRRKAPPDDRLRAIREACPRRGRFPDFVALHRATPQRSRDDLWRKQLPLNPIFHHEMMTTDEC